VSSETLGVLRLRKLRSVLTLDSRRHSGRSATAALCQTETFTSLRTALDASDVTLRQGNALFWFADIERVVSASRRHAIGVA